MFREIEEGEMRGEKESSTMTFNVHWILGQRSGSRLRVGTKEKAENNGKENILGFPTFPTQIPKQDIDTMS